MLENKSNEVNPNLQNFFGSNYSPFEGNIEANNTKQKEINNNYVKNMKIGEILNYTYSFLYNFDNNLHNEVLNIYKDEDISKKYKDNKFKINFIAFFKLINKNNNQLYFGIILILISFLIYLLNITSK